MPDQDIIDRKGAWIERMFDRLFIAIREDVKGTVIVVLVIVCIWQQMTINKSNDLRIADREKFTADMINEVRSTVKRELPKQLAPIQATQDSTNIAVRKAVDTSLINVNQAAENIIKYIKGKKR